MTHTCHPRHTQQHPALLVFPLPGLCHQHVDIGELESQDANHRYNDISVWRWDIAITTLLQRLTSSARVILTPTWLIAMIKHATPTLKLSSLKAAIMISMKPQYQKVSLFAVNIPMFKQETLHRVLPPPQRCLRVRAPEPSVRPLNEYERIWKSTYHCHVIACVDGSSFRDG